VSCFILLYEFISDVYINSTYTHNYHKLFYCIVAFCAIVNSSFILDVLWVFLICMYLCLYIIYIGARGGAVGRGTALQTGRSLDRSPMVPLEFFIDINLPVAL
jgi:hypothetical protein